MTTIDGHTFDEKLLTLSGWVIDAGCRGFAFLEWCKKNKPRLEYHHYNYNYYGVDIEDFDCQIEAVCKKAALTNHSGQVDAWFFGNGTGNFLRPLNDAPGNTPDRPVEMKTVQAITLQDIYNEIGTDIDLLKLDIEGAEYLVLENFEPIPKQITVEFHEHTVPHLHSTHFESIFEGLCKHYNATLHITEWPRYKYMDCLFVRKDLV